MPKVVLQKNLTLLREEAAKPLSPDALGQDYNFAS
jgi:hypothetical protein